MNTTKHTTFAEFFPFYLGEHQHPVCRTLHFIGTSLGLGCLIQALLAASGVWLLAGLVVGYAFAWVGHFVFEKNKPASFKQPLYSFMGDWVMWWQLLTGQLSFKPQDKPQAITQDKPQDTQ
jgi:hypothetical protein